VQSASDPSFTHGASGLPSMAVFVGAFGFVEVLEPSEWMP